MMSIEERFVIFCKALLFQICFYECFHCFFHTLNICYMLRNMTQKHIYLKKSMKNDVCNMREIPNIKSLREREAPPEPL